MSNTKSHKQGHSDGIFRRPMDNTYQPYTDNWHAYNAGYLSGHASGVDTYNLTEGE